jgi:hypothetical protein
VTPRSDVTRILWGGILTTWSPSEAKTASKASVNLRSVADQEAERADPVAQIHQQATGDPDVQAG